MENVVETVALPWKQATKTKKILTKSVASCVQDERILTHLRLYTLEAQEMISPHALFCIAETTGEAWQQEAKKVAEKYTLSGYNSDGWAIQVPKPGNKVNAWRHEGAERFSIVALFGEEIDGFFYQYGKPGDVICQNPNDPRDVWIVAGELFDGTYEFI